MGLFSKKEKKPEEAKAAPVKEEPVKAAPAEKKEKPAPVKEEAEVSKKDKPKVWHITKRAEDGQWQVKGEGAQRATKLFRTKAEAEEYVKTLVANNEGSRAVPHKKDGKYQKK